MHYTITMKQGTPEITINSSITVRFRNLYPPRFKKYFHAGAIRYVYDTEENKIIEFKHRDRMPKLFYNALTDEYYFVTLDYRDYVDLDDLLTQFKIEFYKVPSFTSIGKIYDRDFEVVLSMNIVRYLNVQKRNTNKFLYPCCNKLILVDTKLHYTIKDYRSDTLNFFPLIAGYSKKNYEFVYALFNPDFKFSLRRNSYLEPYKELCIVTYNYYNENMVNPFNYKLYLQAECFSAYNYKKGNDYYNYIIEALI